MLLNCSHFFQDMLLWFVIKFVVNIEELPWRYRSYDLHLVFIKTPSLIARQFCSWARYLFYANLCASEVSSSHFCLFFYFLAASFLLRYQSNASFESFSRSYRNYVQSNPQTILSKVIRRLKCCLSIVIISVASFLFRKACISFSGLIFSNSFQFDDIIIFWKIWGNCCYYSGWSVTSDRSVVFSAEQLGRTSTSRHCFLEVDSPENCWQ